MAGPPDNIPANELWTLITAMPRPHKVVDFPRKDPATGEPICQFAMVVLRQEEQMAASVAAEREAKRLLKEESPKVDDGARQAYEDIYKNAASTEVVYRASKRLAKDGQSATNEPFFPSPAVMRKELTGDEIGTLVAHYFTVQSELGPIIGRLTSEEQDAWIKRLTEGGSSLPLDLLSWDALKTLAFSLACRAASSLTGTSSPGSPPDETMPDASPE